MKPIILHVKCHACGEPVNVWHGVAGSGEGFATVFVQPCPTCLAAERQAVQALMNRVEYCPQCDSALPLRRSCHVCGRILS